MIRFAFIFGFLPCQISAEPVTIRSGEHDTFTRLVLAIEEGTEWNVVRSDEGFSVQLINENDGFDTSGVFDRIPRERLKGLRQISSNSLSLETNCDCSIDTFLWRADRLVVDVLDNADPRFDHNLVRQRTTDDLSSVSVFSNGTNLPDVFGHASGLSLTEFRSVGGQEQISVFPEIAEMPDIITSEAALLEGLARAASQGFLTPNVQSFLNDEATEGDVAIEGFATETVPLEDGMLANIGQMRGIRYCQLG